MPNVESKSVMTVGDALIDRQYWVDAWPKAGEDVPILSTRRNTGGSAANTAIMLAKQHVPCFFCGCVGDDEDGNCLTANLNAEGVDTSCILQSGSTGFCVAVIDSTGERTMLSYRGASGTPIRVTPLLEKSIAAVSVVLMSGYLLSNAKQASAALCIAKTAKRAGGMVALDPSPMIGKADKDVLARLLGNTDILLPNAGELRTMAATDDAAEALKTLPVPCIAVKKGAGGAALAIKAGFRLAQGQAQALQTYEAAAQHVQAVDTTGAGDAFNAGFIASYLRGDAPDMWIQNGNALAAQVIVRKGAATV